MPTNTEKAYAAGFIDGDGCIHITRDASPARLSQYPGYDLVIVIVQKDRPVLEWFHRLWPEGKRKICLMRPGFWQLRFFGQYAFQLLEDTAPYLVLKKAEAEVAMGFWRWKQPFMRIPRSIPRPPIYYQRGERFHLEVRRLKKCRGVSLEPSVDKEKQEMSPQPLLPFFS